ncbi:PAC2 family protein [Candidatus Woesearchaeota archaeon]|nr:PAC2 family protein [Candidatus Woesearchaeota archaeon]
MNMWKLIKTAKVPKLNSPVLIEGLPGIGNVGKVSVDFMVDELKAEKIYEMTSNSMPHSVFVNEQNLVELPVISVYYKKFKNRDILFVAGDAQPIDEASSYEFSYAVLDLLKQFKGKDIITLGGIGLPAIPKKPKVYCTGTSKAFIESYSRDTSAIPNLYGVVGPIIGVSGLLLGLAKRENMNGVSFLAETYGHPMYLGIRGAREIVKILNKKLSLGINIKELDLEIDELEEEAVRNSKAALEKAARGMPAAQHDASYIG